MILDFQKEAWNNYVKTFKNSLAYKQYPMLYWWLIEV